MLDWMKRGFLSLAILGFCAGTGPSALFDLAASAAPPQDRYIVVLNADGGFPEDVAADVALRTNGRVGYVYETVLQGFSITMPRAARAGVARDPRVAYVEEDIPVSVFAQTLPTGVDRIFQPGIGNSPPTTGSDIDSALSIDGVDDWRVDVDVAVLDTGIDRQHPDLNVVGGANCMKTTGGGPPWARSYYCDDTKDGDDDHYHGTHVAGTIGAIDNGIGVVGVAPGARLWAVKVLDSQGSGYLSGIIAGIDWVVAHEGIYKPAVINMSLGGSGSSSAMDDAITNAVGNGVAVVVAAGNSDANAANYTPANSPDAITVSALADFDGAAGGSGSPTCRTDQDDTLADFSNWGAVDIAAPGVCIYSTYPIEQGAYGTISGTSMASPHVAGAAALLASNGDAPAAIRSTLLSSGNDGWTDDSGDGTKEPLLDISTFAAAFVSTGGGGGNTAPEATDDSYNMTEGTTLSVPAPGVLGNDNDVDGDSLTAILAANASNGSLTLNADGSFEYTPNAGVTGDSFTYVANDGTYDSNVATVTVTVEAAGGGGTAPMVIGCQLSGDPVPGARITVTVMGSNFVSGAIANFGSRIAVQNVSVDPSGEQLDAAIKIHRRASGDKSVTVTNPDGQNDTLPVCFTVN